MQDFLAMYDGVCDQTKEIQTLQTKELQPLSFDSMSNDFKWIISSSGRYMFVRFNINLYSASKFLAKIHYGKEILNTY